MGVVVAFARCPYLLPTKLKEVPDIVVRVDNKSEVQTQTYSGVSFWVFSANVMKGVDFHPKDHSIQLFTDPSNKGWGAHLEQTST